MIWEVRIVAVHGLASCSICGQLFSWKVSLEGIELEELVVEPRCPCGSEDVTVRDGSIYPDIEIAQRRRRRKGAKK